MALSPTVSMLLHVLVSIVFLFVLFSLQVELVSSHEGPHEPMDMDQIKTKFDQLKQGNLDSEEDHIREHLENIANIPEEKMTREQKHFHYFILHDTDRNLKIDGLEILHAMFHRDVSILFITHAWKFFSV